MKLGIGSYAYTWAVGVPNYPQPDRFREVVERYDGDGVDDMPGLVVPVRHYQVGNEYVNPVYWTGTIDDYRTYLDIVAAAARRAFPDVVVVSNGIRWNDLFIGDPTASAFDERFAAFVAALPTEVWRHSWQRARTFTEAVVSMADRYDVLDAGGNGPHPEGSAGYMAWVRRALARHGRTTTIWDMESRCEPQLVPVQHCTFRHDRLVPGGRHVLAALRSSWHRDHTRAVAWYRAEQASLLMKVFVTRFAAGFEKVFMGMPEDWDGGWSVLAHANPYLGLIGSSGELWPAYHAFALLVRHLDGFTKAERADAPPGVECYRFDFAAPRPPVHVAWLADDVVRGIDSPIPRRTVVLSAVEGPVTVIAGDERRMGTAGRPLSIELDATPVIIVR